MPSSSGLPEHQGSPYDALPASAIVLPLVGALVRGRFGVIPEIITRARRISEYDKALAERRRLLHEVSPEKT